VAGALLGLLALSVTDAVVRRGLAGSGLEGRYYANPGWEGTPVLAALEPRPSTAVLKSRLPRLPRPFSAEWDGQLWVDRSQSRSFSLVTGGSAWLSVDGRLVLHAVATGGLRQFSAPVPLEPGSHRLQLRYVPLGLGDDRLDLAWQEGDGRPRPLPRHALSPPAAAQGGSRVLGGVARIARPLWVAGGLLLAAFLLARLVPGGRPPAERVLLASGSVLLAAVAFLLAGGPALLWPELEVDTKRAVLALALYALLPWALLASRSALRGGGWRNALLGAVSLLIAAGAGEVLLRVLRPDESRLRFRWIASAKYHHINPPSLRMFAGRVGGAPILVETNEDGLRTSHSRQSFRRHAVRILVLGDSFAFGPGVPGEQTFPAELERVLRARPGGDDVAVLNAAVIGYSPYLEKLLFADLVEHYRPTLVLLLLDATDIGDDDVYRRLARPGPGPPTFEAQGETRLAYRGALYELLRPLIQWGKDALVYPWALASDALELSQGAGRGGFNYYVLPIEVAGGLDNRFFIYRHPLAATRPFFEATLGNVRETAKRAREARAGFALLVSPRYHHWSEREAPDNWERGSYGNREPYQYEYFRFFEESRPGLDFAVHDLLPAFRSTEQFPLVFPNDPHWNAKGHAFVAQTVADYLVREGFVGR
jgi:hypothetical protein